jgi:hypothetical protein
MIENARSAPSIPPFCVCGRVTTRMSFAAAGQLVGVKTPACTVPPTIEAVSIGLRCADPQHDSPPEALSSFGASLFPRTAVCRLEDKTHLTPHYAVLNAEYGAANSVIGLTNLHSRDWGSMRPRAQFDPASGLLQAS